MMSTLRDKKTMQVVLWFLVVAFVATIFISWGMKGLKSNMDDRGLVAKIGDDKITDSDFQKFYQPQLEKLYRMRTEPPSSEEVASLKKQVLDSMIDNDLLQQVARKLGVRVSDEELAATLQHQPYFADETGKFSSVKYYQVLQANQLTPEIFEASQRMELLMQKISGLLQDSVLFTNDGLSDYAALLSRNLKTDYFSLNPKSFEKDVTASESDLKDYYENNKTKYDHPERQKVRHILIAAQGSDNPLDQDKAEKTLAEYRKEILAGKATFSELAKKFSQDPGTKSKGGELGWVSRGMMIKEFEDAVYALKKGEISKPFKTKYGYHLAEVESVEKEYKSVFKEVRADVLKQYKKEKSQQKIYALATQLGEKMKSKVPLKKATSDLGLNSNSSEWFDGARDIPGIKDSKYVAAELTNLYPGDWAGPYPLNEKEYFFQITEAKDGTGKATEEKKREIAQRYIKERPATWLRDYLSTQRKKIVVKTYLNS